MGRTWSALQSHPPFVRGRRPLLASRPLETILLGTSEAMASQTLFWVKPRAKPSTNLAVVVGFSRSERSEGCEETATTTHFLLGGGWINGVGVLLSKRVIYLLYWFACCSVRGDLLVVYIPTLLVDECRRIGHSGCIVKRRDKAQLYGSGCSHK